MVKSTVEAKRDPAHGDHTSRGPVSRPVRQKRHAHEARVSGWSADKFKLEKKKGRHVHCATKRVCLDGALTNSTHHEGTRIREHST